MSFGSKTAKSTPPTYKQALVGPADAEDRGALRVNLDGCEEGNILLEQEFLKVILEQLALKPWRALVLANSRMPTVNHVLILKALKGINIAEFTGGKFLVGDLMQVLNTISAHNQPLKWEERLRCLYLDRIKVVGESRHRHSTTGRYWEEVNQVFENWLAKSDHGVERLKIVGCMLLGSWWRWALPNLKEISTNFTALTPFVSNIHVAFQDLATLKKTRIWNLEPTWIFPGDETLDQIADRSRVSRSVWLETLQQNVFTGRNTIDSCFSSKEMKDLEELLIALRDNPTYRTSMTTAKIIFTLPNALMAYIFYRKLDALIEKVCPDLIGQNSADEFKSSIGSLLNIAHKNTQDEWSIKNFPKTRDFKEARALYNKTEKVKPKQPTGQFVTYANLFRFVVSSGSGSKSYADCVKPANLTAKRYRFQAESVVPSTPPDAGYNTQALEHMTEASTDSAVPSRSSSPYNLAVA